MLLIASILFLTVPVVKGIEQCRKSAAEISYGRLDQRLKFQSDDEVGELVRDLNILNSIRELALTAPSESVDMIEALASFYHSCLINRSKPLSLSGRGI